MVYPISGSGSQHVFLPQAKVDSRDEGCILSKIWDAFCNMIKSIFSCFSSDSSSSLSDRVSYGNNHQTELFVAIQEGDLTKALQIESEHPELLPVAGTYAISCGNDEIACALIDRVASIKPEIAMSHLFNACSKGLPQTVQKLIKRDMVDLSLMENGKNALHYAIWGDISGSNQETSANRFRIAALLVQKDPSIVTRPLRNGKSALSAALFKKEYDIAQLLANHGADLTEEFPDNCLHTSADDPQRDAKINAVRTGDMLALKAFNQHASK